MKQRIEPQLLVMLSEEAKAKWIAWWDPEINEVVVYKGEKYPVDGLEGNNVGAYNVWLANCRELGPKPKSQVRPIAPTIGQMLKYLANQEPDHFHGLSRDGRGIFSVVWDSADERFTKNTRFAGEPRSGSPVTHLRYREGDELVDTLWFVVSTALESAAITGGAAA